MMKITASFVLGLLFVMHGLCDFTAHANHQGKEELLMTEQKELVGELSETSSSSRIVGIGGRKMTAGNGELTHTTTSATSTKNSGKDITKAPKYNFHRGPQTKLEQKGEIKKMKATASKIGSFGDEPREHYSQVVDEETRRLLEAEREIVNLMRKDYKGSSGGKGMGLRKPPINNNEPHH